MHTLTHAYMYIQFPPSTLPQVPDVQSPVRPTGGQYGLIVRRPLDLEYLIPMAFKRVEFHLEVTHVPESNSLREKQERERERGKHRESETE